MKLLATLLILLSLTINHALADDHDHENFPEGTLLALEGRNAVTNEECFLFVLDVGFTGPEKTADQFYAKVTSGKEADGGIPPTFNVAINSNVANSLSGTADDGKSQVALFTNGDITDLRNITSANFKWWHETHFHYSKCVDFTVHQD